MSLKFRGGERYQRGRGIGGFFKTIINAFKPLFKSAGTSIAKAATSRSGKMLGKALKDQALTSVANLSADALRGNDFGESLSNELVSGRRNIANTIENVARRENKRKSTSISRKGKKVKRSTIKENVAKKYMDLKSNDIFD